MFNRYLESDKSEIKVGYITQIDVNTIDNETNQVEIRLEIRDNDKTNVYNINSIKASENNLSVLWNIYDNNEQVEVVIINRDRYLILKLLGLYVTLLQVNEWLWLDINLIKF